MKSVSIAALAAILSTGAQAVPTFGHKHNAAAHGHLHHKRDVVWVTEFEIATVTVMKTVFADGSEPTDSPLAYSSTEVTVSSTEPSAPASSTETSTFSAPAAYTAPTTSSVSPIPTTFATSSSTYVAPPITETTSSSTTTYQALAPETTTTTISPAYVAPETTSTSVAPETTSASVAPETTTAAAAPTATQTSGSYSGDTSTSSGASYSGDFTHWDPAMGACGWTNSADEPVVALSEVLFDPSTPGGNPNNNPLCGRYVTLVGKDGSSYQAKVVDRCVGCAKGDLDLTISLFNTVTSNGDGRVSNMKWSWN